MFMTTVAIMNNGDQISLLQVMISGKYTDNLFCIEDLIGSPRSICLELAYPLIAGFVSTSLYCDKYVSKYDRYTMVRSGKSLFAVSQIIGVITVSFVLSIIAYTIYFICVFIVVGETMTASMVLSIFFRKTFGLWLMLCFGGLLSLVTAVITANKYIALLLPVYICYILQMISSKMMKTIDWFDAESVKKYWQYEMINPKCLYYFETVIENLEMSVVSVVYPAALIGGLSLIAFIFLKYCRKGF